MRIDEKSIFYWSLLGFKIGGLEFLWDSPYKEAQDLFEGSKQEIMHMLDEDVPVNESDYHAFSESIVYYYMRNDAEKFSLLMIVRCVQRCGLLKVCKTAETREEILQLARGCIAPIPTSVVDDKELLFSIIMRNADKSLMEIMSMVYEAVFSNDNAEADDEAQVNEKNLRTRINICL